MPIFFFFQFVQLTNAYNLINLHLSHWFLIKRPNYSMALHFMSTVPPVDFKYRICKVSISDVIRWANVYSLETTMEKQYQTLSGDRRIFKWIRNASDISFRSLWKQNSFCRQMWKISCKCFGWKIQNIVSYNMVVYWLLFVYII